jgi:hypothetical protein
VQPKGTQALAVLQAWNERLQGDWEHAPTRRDYHAVLAAYASEGAAAANNNSNNYNVGSKNDDNNPHDPTRTETPDTNLEGAHVAVETTQWLQQQYVLDMRPNAETYALGCLCIAQAIRKKKKWNNNDDDNNDTEICNTRRELKGQLQTCQQELLRSLQKEILLNGDITDHAKKDGSCRTQNRSRDQWTLRGLNVAVQECSSDQELSDWVQVWQSLIARIGIEKNGDNTDELQQLIYMTTTTLLKHCRAVTATPYSNEQNNNNETAPPELLLCQLIDTILFVGGGIEAKHFCLAIRARIQVLNSHHQGSSPIERTSEDRRVQQWFNQLQEMHRDYVETATHQGFSNDITRSYNYLLMAAFEMGRFDIVLACWDKMRIDPSVQPDVRSYSYVLRTLAEQATPESAQQAHDIWYQDLLQSGTNASTSNSVPTTTVRPTAEHYGLVMAAWSRIGHKQAYERCRQVMDQLYADSKVHSDLEPTAVHFTALIKSHRSSDARMDAENLMRSIDEMIESGVQRDHRVYTTSLACLARIGSEEGARRAQQLLDEMETEFRSGRDDLSPNRTCYASAMMGWSLSGAANAVRRCQSLLQRLEEAYINSGHNVLLRPDWGIYLSLIRAHTRSGDPAVALQIENVLNHMETAASQGMATLLDEKFYGQVMFIVGSSRMPDAPIVAESILNRMSRAHESGLISEAPDSRSWAGVVYAWAKSDRPDKAIRAKKLVEHMLTSYKNGNLNMKPEAPSYVAVLNACAHTESTDARLKAEVARIALATLKEMEEVCGSTAKNECVYRQVFKALGQNVSDRTMRNQIVQVIFDQCCHEGLVSSEILRLLRRYVPSIHKKLDRDIDRKLVIPAEWRHRLL